MTAVTPPTAASLLDAWERGRAAAAPWRGAALLSAALPDAPPEALADLRPGQLDRLLLDLRGHAFGHRAELVADCPGCGVRVQFRGTLTPPDPLPDREPAEVAAGGYRLSVRPPSLGDLADAAATGDPEAARRLLLERTVTLAEGKDGAVSPQALPGPVVAAAEAALAAADPPAVPDIPLVCPDCGTGWTARLDVAAFLWEEVETWARRTLGEVAALARAYGWREADILALSPWRRRAYLEMAGT